MPYEVAIGDGADALGQNQLTDALDGTYWVSGWDATLGTGDLEVDIAAGEGAINGGDVSTGAVQTIDFTGDPDATDPRKAVISVDDTGTVQKTLGNPAPADPTNEIRFRTHDPAPPTNAPGVVVAEVWLDAGVTSLVSDDVRDRRVSNDAVETVQPEPNVPNWVEDGNSPHISTSENSTTYTLDGTYDYVMVQYNMDASSSLSDVRLRVNGDTTTSYGYAKLQSGVETSQDSIRIGQFVGNPNVPSGFKMSGRWGSLWTYAHDGPMYRVTDIAHHGNNDNVSSPLTQFTILESGSTNWDELTIEVYGRNIG